MNYLAHLFLAEPTDEGRIGSLLADFTVGTIEDLQSTYGNPIARSIKHHREIDRFTDTHSAVMHSTEALAKGYGVYSGIVLDVVFDHFLLKHWELYAKESKEQFYDSAYRSLARNDWEYPARYKFVVGRLIEKKWLDAYSDLEKVSFALSKIGERFNRKTPLADGVAPIRENYDLIDTDFLVFFPELKSFSEDVLLQQRNEIAKSPGRPT